VEYPRKFSRSGFQLWTLAMQKIFAVILTSTSFVISWSDAFC